MRMNSDKSSRRDACSSTLHHQFADNQQLALTKRYSVCSWDRLREHWLTMGLMLVAMSPSWAAETQLGSVGNTQLQQNTGDAVQFTCGDFIAAGANPLTTPLFQTCRAMVQTATNGENSLGITDDELANGLQHVATEEFAASGQLGTEVGSNRINIGINRLIEVRRGAKGFNIAGLSPGSNILLAANSKQSDAYTGERGGAAGDSEVWDKLGVFITGNYSTGDRDRTSRTDSFDFDAYGTTLGMDYRFTENIILGAALSYNDLNSDFDKRSTVPGGGVDADGWGGFVYGTYYQDRFYIDGLAGYAKSDYDVKRKISISNNNALVFGGEDIKANVKGSPDSNDYTASIGGGYHFSQGAMSYGPYGRLTYLKVEVDDYKESGAGKYGLNLDVDGQDWKSVTSVLGGQISYASSQSFGVVMPQGRLAWVHEYEDDSTKMKATYIDDPSKNTLLAITDDPDSDYFELGIGVSTVFENGVQAFFNYDTILGMDDFTIHMFSLGGRWEF
jgi:outer membrane lipase/esterase